MSKINSDILHWTELYVEHKLYWNDAEFCALHHNIVISKQIELLGCWSKHFFLNYVCIESNFKWKPLPLLMPQKTTLIHLVITHWKLLAFLTVAGAEFVLPWYVKTYWVFHNIAVPISFLITIFYWTILYEGKDYSRG